MESSGKVPEVVELLFHIFKLNRFTAVLKHLQNC